MEQHPVPQNVTTFQFRLIGDMTIKQFGYLAGGAILAYVCYKLPLPFFFSWPLAFIAGLAGFGFAFVPVEDRPMDIWVLSFLKNVYSPTQFVWTQEAPPTTVQPKPVPTAAKAKTDVLQHIFAQQSPIKTTQPKKDPFDWITKIFQPKTVQRAPQAASRPTPPAPTQPTAFATPSITGSKIDLTPPPQVTHISQAPKPTTPDVSLKAQQELQEKSKELTSALAAASLSDARILELQKQLMEVLKERDRMQAEISSLHQQKQPTVAAPQQATTVATPAVPHQPTVRIITAETAVKAGLPRLTTFPNVVTGIVRDSENTLLPGVLVTVRDKEGVPLRALKSNRLGQFAASTPIPNGTYLVEIEDPRGRFVFDRVQITLNGSIVPALEIFAKSQRQVSREKLAKEIFGP